MVIRDASLLRTLKENSAMSSFISALSSRFYLHLFKDCQAEDMVSFLIGFKPVL